jgi:uncharacterized membrane protein
MVDQTNASVALALPVRLVDVERPWAWLAAGWGDLRAAAAVSLLHGLVLAAVSGALTLGLWRLGLFYLVLPLAAGFMLIGPLLAVGLYEVSRRLEQGEAPTLVAALAAWGRRPGPLAVLGLVLMLVMLAWIRIAFLIFALFYGTAQPNWTALIASIFFTLDGVPFLLVGSAVGAVLAAFVFAIAAVAPPLLLDRDIGALAAMATSAAAVARNWRVMVGWGALIVLFTAAGLATFYLGLIVTWPLIGHASWHAYRDLVARS